MQKRQLIIGALAVAAIGAWYAFRPERLFIDKTVSESLGDAYAATPPAGAAEPVALAVGQFHSVSHETMGRASILELPGGKRVLRLTEFATSNGPDVQIYLVAAPDAGDNETVTRAGFLNVGAMKGNQGDQNYELPDDIDLSKYQAVTVWCRRFGVNFGTAPLMAPGAVAAAASAERPPVPVAAGRFHSNAHETTGNATILRLENGTRVLRLTTFATSNGPDVRVYLVAAADVQDDASVKTAGFIDLGAMKGNRGDQNYVIPESVDLTQYRTVTIWCRRFGVNFGSAPLQAGRPSVS